MTTAEHTKQGLWPAAGGEVRGQGEVTKELWSWQKLEGEKGGGQQLG